MTTKNKVLLIILDGWGLSPSEKGNAPLLAKTPTLDYIYSNYPKTSIAASGLEVGLNPGEPGNSEVGHLNLGSGRVAWESLPRINQAIVSGDFFTNPALLQAVEHARKNNSTLHIWGLVSDGGVHSHLRHLVALIQLAAREKLEKVLIHFIADGRDTAPKQAEAFIKQIEEAIAEHGLGRIATITGRYFAMDRDKNWDRVSKAYDLIINNTGEHYNNATEAIKSAYRKGQSDEFLEPMVIGEGGKISQNDSIIFLNFRSDRARQMLDVLSVSDQETFPHTNPSNLFIATMARYRKEQSAPVAYEKINLKENLAEILSEHNLSQYHVAETEKYAHVTYFFDGGIEKPFPKEDQVIIPSKKVATYDLAPAMSALEVSEKVKEAISHSYDFIVVNFANGDMVGHTGDLDAAIEACQTIDGRLNEVLSHASSEGYSVLITADHGNCEVMIDEISSEPNKEHTTNPVPLVYLDFKQKPFTPDLDSSFHDYEQYAAAPPIGVLADVAPSILSILGVKKPAEMAGMDLTGSL